MASPAIDGLNRLLRRLAVAAAYFAAAALSVSVGVTVADILLRRTINQPITGVVDLTQLSVMWAAFCSIPVAFHLDNHISVVMVTDRMPLTVRRWVYAVGTLACAVMLMAAALTAATKGYAEYLQADRSMVLGIPLVWYWVPVVLGFALASACALGRSLQYAFAGVPVATVEAAHAQ